MRTDQATRVFGDIRINVVVSAVVFVAAVFYVALDRRPREVLPSRAERSGPDPDPGRDPEGDPDSALTGVATRASGRRRAGATEDRPSETDEKKPQKERAGAGAGAGAESRSRRGRAGG